MNLTDSERKNLLSLMHYLQCEYDLSGISLEDLAICFSSEKRAVDLNVYSSKAYAVIGDKYLDAVLFEYIFKLNGYLDAKQLDDFRQKNTDNKNHERTMIDNKLDIYIMNGPRINDIRTRAGKETLSATYEALIYVVYKNFGSEILLNFLMKIYKF